MSAKSFRRELWQSSVLRNSGSPLSNISDNRCGAKKIDELRHFRRKARPKMNQSHRIGVTWTQPAFIMVRQKLGFVSRHIHIDRAIRFTAFAREAKVERFQNFFAAPAITDDFALHHFEKHSCAATGRMHFFTRDHVARAHRSAFSATTFSDRKSTRLNSSH